MRTEELLFRSAVALYGVSAFGYVFGLLAKAEKLFRVGLAAAILGFLPHTVSIALRWSSGANPFITISESLSLGVWVSVLLYLALQLASRAVRPVGVLVMPVGFVLVGWAATLRTAPAAEIVPALQSGWLWVHIVGASVGFSSVLVASALGLLFLLRGGKLGGISDRLPSPDALDNLSYRFVIGGFTMYGVMIVSGAFWANQVKGNFWNWDPVEIWSLVSWLTYAIYLHLRITFGWRGRRMAVYVLVAMLAMIVAYWGIPFSVETFHSGFRIEH